jgi:dTDP-4-amino-4,6-dideoxygalactose transaminase
VINVFQPQLGAEELAAVADVFERNWVGRGPRSTEFEAAFAKHIDVPPAHVTAVSSCTAGLFLAIQLLELSAADDVVLSSLSFVSAANAVGASGARPVFCDVDPRTLNPTLDNIEARITPRTKAVILQHYGGYPGEVVRIADRCRQLGITLIEDAACSVSSTVDGQACGTFGDIATWSFDAMKILVTGDGGMLYVRDAELARRARRAAYLGLEQSSGYSAARAGHRWWEVDVRDFGSRVIGNDLTAAIGLVQLRKLPGFIKRRSQIVEYYDHALADLDGVLLPPPLPAGHESSYYFYWVQTEPGIRDVVAKELYEAGIFTTFKYPALHKVPIYRDHCELPNAEKAAAETLLLPLHQGLEDTEVDFVATEFRKAFVGHS